VRTAIMPGFSELIITINPAKEAIRDRTLNFMMPWLYAPWPDARQKGVIEMEVAGETLRALLNELSSQYQQAGVDFIPINRKTNQVDFDYDIFVNDRKCLALPVGLDTELKDGDEVRVKILWRWDG